MSALVVIPALDEAAHIAAVIEALLPFARRTGARIVVADGGSADGTRAIVAALARREPAVVLLDNPLRRQAAGVNLAVERFAGDAEWLIRIDAHSAYPPDYCERLVAEARRTGADSVVVAMRAVGASPLQRVIALAQNSRLGNGGAAHRNRAEGRWVDHGHHALMRLAAFRAVGGYDEAFSHNEDAELDLRLRRAGFRIWLTGATAVDYFPRRTLGALMRQYFAFGRGRARNLIKHRTGFGGRQAAVAALAPGLALAPLAAAHPAFALPVAAWSLGCLAGGLGLAARHREPAAAAAGLVAGAMHAAWSAGFWAEALGAAARRALPSGGEPA